MDPAIRRVAEMKPPANIDGLLQFRKDVTEDFTVDEQAAVWRSESGQRVRNAFDRCEGHNQQWMSTRHKLNEIVKSGRDPSSQDLVKARRDTILKKLKYVDCLAFMLDKQYWNQYTMCWVQTVGNMPQNDLKSYKEEGTLDAICRAQRASLEGEMGKVVSRAVQAGDSVALEIERNSRPLL